MEGVRGIKEGDILARVFLSSEKVDPQAAFALVVSVNSESIDVKYFTRIGGKIDHTITNDDIDCWGKVVGGHFDAVIRYWKEGPIRTKLKCEYFDTDTEDGCLDALIAIKNRLRDLKEINKYTPDEKQK